MVILAPATFHWPGPVSLHVISQLQRDRPNTCFHHIFLYAKSLNITETPIFFHSFNKFVRQ